MRRPRHGNQASINKSSRRTFLIYRQRGSRVESCTHTHTHLLPCFCWKIALTCKNVWFNWEKFVKKILCPNASWWIFIIEPEKFLKFEFKSFFHKGAFNFQLVLRKKKIFRRGCSEISRNVEKTKDPTPFLCIFPLLLQGLQRNVFDMNPSALGLSWRGKLNVT